MNKVIKLLLLSDIFMLTGFGLIEPILAIYFKENLIGGTIFAAGIASAIFWITKCVIQLPFSKYVDSHDHKVRFLIIGALIVSSIPFIYAFSTHIYQIYFAQFLYGIGSGIAFPTWLGLWSTHLDKNHESYEWSLYSTLTGIGTALTAAIGAGIAQYLGFKITFALVGILSLVGAFILLKLELKDEKKNQTKLSHYHTKRKILQKH